jgi:hypothetical protein
MITLTKRIRQEAEGTEAKPRKEEAGRVSIRDKLLVKGVQEMEENKPQSCKVKFEDPNLLHDFHITISPEEGFWQGGKFRFHVKVKSGPCRSVRFSRFPPDPSRVQHPAALGDLPDPPVAPQHLRGRPDLPLAAPPALRRRPWLGAHQV